MKARSAKNKGLRFENFLKEKLRQELDINTSSNNGSGAGLDKGDLRIPSLNMNVEAKNSATFHIDGDWEQTKRQCTGNDIPVLAIRHPKQPEFKEVLVVMNLEDWINLVAGQMAEREVIENLDPKIKYLIQNTRENLRQLLKHYEA
jgi:hypothetical protein